MHPITLTYLRQLQEEILRKQAKTEPLVPKQDSVDLRNPDTNIVFHSIKRYIPDYDMTQKHPESNLTKQYVIGMTNKLAASGSPEYKQAVFDAYKTQQPHIVAHAKNYDELVNRCYAAAKRETVHQFDSLPIDTSYHQGEFNYKSSGEMVNDVHQNHHMAVYSGGEPHTHLDKAPGDDLTANEKFRAVHDFYGHALHGNQFGPKGEEVAWNIHQQMYSSVAKPAVTAETRGQNSEVNYTLLNHDNIKGMQEHRKLASVASEPHQKQFHMDKVREIGSNWNYARQIASILPPEMNSPHFNGEVPAQIRPLLLDKEGTRMSTRYNTTKDHLGLYKLAMLHNPSDAEQVTNELAQVHGYRGIISESVTTNHGDEVIHDEDYATIHQKQQYAFD